MRKDDIQKRVFWGIRPPKSKLHTKGEENIGMYLFDWNEFSRTFITYADSIFLDFSNIDRANIIAGANSTFIAGSNCIFIVDYECTFYNIFDGENNVIIKRSGLETINVNKIRDGNEGKILRLSHFTATGYEILDKENN